MKPFLILLAGLLFTSALSQNEKFILGLRGGASKTYFLGQQGSNSKTYGLSGALSMQYNLGKHFAFVSCPAFEQGRPDFTATFANLPFMPVFKSVNLKLNYVSLPLLLRAYYGNKIRVYSDMGVFVTGLYNATCLINTGYNTYTEDYTAFFTRYNYGAVFALGAQYKTGNIMFSAGAEGCLALNNAFNQPKESGFISPATRIAGLSLSFGISYCFGETKNRPSD